MDPAQRSQLKHDFRQKLQTFIESLREFVSTSNGEWTIKGFIDIFQNIYTISGDTKVVSKIIELHLLPKIFEFADQSGYKIVLPDHQNYYPDLSFIDAENESIKFAVDIKTSYRLPDNPEYCSGFTLGSYRGYFTARDSRKNIQFPYNQYLGHFCLGVIYSRTVQAKEHGLQVHSISDLQSIASVINNFIFFVREKWEIASDTTGSGNTANIGSITNINDLVHGSGVFKNLGESIFDEYWMNYGQIKVPDENGEVRRITRLAEFLSYRGIDPDQIHLIRARE
ncbi:type II restriction endonuclease [Chloroflexus islandicus]|uniref:type II restriction endonuclease n=1 Tax=Chloroflexus islandicus TaxID=1707952 RepID=UPI0009785AA6|nr:type II restriction endonuclease [Chloroflexus islandicus]